MLKRIIKTISLLILFSLSIVLISCNEENNTPLESHNTCPYCNKCSDSNCPCLEKCSCEPLVINEEVFNLYENTIWETPAYLFKTNKPGPGIVIVGGTHGDEIAGWHCGLELIKNIKNERGIRGNILIIPQINILADIREERFIGKILGESNSVNKTVTINGVTDTYSDLNRSFENGRSSYSTERTIWLSDGLVKVIEDFDTKYGADYLVDLHEAKHSWDNQEYGYEGGSLGDTIIFTNLPRVCRQIIKNYNDNYLLENETQFVSQDAYERGSFSYTMSAKYPESVVFTIETNREFVYTSKTTGYDSKPLEDRVRMQNNVLRSMFDIAWDRLK